MARGTAIRAPDGAREAEPLILMLLAITVPLSLVTAAAAGGGVAPLVLALVVMVGVCLGIAVFLARLTRTSSDDTSSNDASIDRDRRAHPG